MARLRIFISSTCYDLGILRGELRPFVQTMGYDPIMSENSDILYDHRLHTHHSCVKEVISCDMLVLIIGARFGGEAIPSVFADIDIEAVKASSTRTSLLEGQHKFSITQMEVLKAVESSVPVYAFVDDRVLHDHLVYEKNKHNADVMSQLQFPSIQRNDTARYIFEFINFLTHQNVNNSITSFTRLQDIREHLGSQWSQLFQRLLYESRSTAQEARRYQDFSEKIDDLKAAVLASATSPDLRDLAKGAVEFRHLVGFLSGLKTANRRKLLLSTDTWAELLASVGIVDVRTVRLNNERGLRPETFFIVDDGTFYRSRYSAGIVDQFEAEWGRFQKLPMSSREAIVDALMEDQVSGHMPVLRHIDQSYEDFAAERTSQAPLPKKG